MMKRTGAISSLMGSMISFMPWTFFRIAPIWGSYLSFFTGSQIMVPLAGALASRRALSATWLLKAAFYGITHQAAPWFALAYHLPTTSAALYIASPITSINRALTVLAFSGAALVFAGAVGATPALLYATLWIIPAALAAYGAHSFLSRSIVATFLAHAIGSAIWAWAFPLAPAAWVALIPVALVERLVYTSGISLGWLCIIHAPRWYRASSYSTRHA